MTRIKKPISIMKSEYPTFIRGFCGYDLGKEMEGFYTDKKHLMLV